MLNTVSLIGRLTKEPELRTTNSGASVVTTCLAVQRDYVKKDEERQTDFIDCVGWNQIAELISKYLHKGSQVAVTGRLQTRTFEDKDGKKRKMTEVILSNISFLEKKESAKEEEPVEFDEDSIPF